MNKICEPVLLIYKFMIKMNKDKVRAHAAEAAFFIIMSFFPVLMILLTLIKFTPLDQTQVMYALEEITPFEVTGLLEPVVDSLFNHSAALLSWNIFAAVWAGGKGIMGLMDGLNSISQVHETRNYFAIRIRCACYTVVMVLALIVSLGILVFGYEIQKYLRTHFSLLQKYSDTMVLPMLIAMLILVLLFVLLYTFLPNCRMKFFRQIPGGIFTALSWAVFSYAFSIYLNYAVNMSVIYGSLTTLIVVMLWLYSSMYLLFIGAEINHYLVSPELFTLDR